MNFKKPAHEFLQLENAQRVKWKVKDNEVLNGWISAEMVDLERHN